MACYCMLTWGTIGVAFNMGEDRGDLLLYVNMEEDRGGL